MITAAARVGNGRNHASFRALPTAPWSQPPALCLSKGRPSAARKAPVPRRAYFSCIFSVRCVAAP